MATKGIGLITISFLSKLITSIELGIYNSYINAAAYINQIADLGASTVLQKASACAKDSESKKVLEKKMSAAILLGGLSNLCILLLVTLNIEFFSQLLFNQKPVDLTHLLILITIIQFFFQLPTYVLMGIGHFRYYSLRNIVTAFTSLLCVIVPAIFWGLRGAIFGYLAATLINTAFTWIITLRILKLEQIKISLNSSFSGLVQVLKEGFWFYFGNTFLGAIAGLFTITLFSKYISIESFGFLRIAASINAITAIIPSALMPVTLSVLSRHSEQDTIRIKSFQIRYVFGAIFLFTSLLLLGIKPVIDLLFNAEYEKGLVLICPLILVNIIILMQGLFSNFLIAGGKMKFLGTISTLSIVLHIILSYLLIPGLGNTGYLISWLVPQFLSHLLTTIKEFSSNQSYKKIKEIKWFYLITIPALFITFYAGFLPISDPLRVYVLICIIPLYFIAFIKFAVSGQELTALNKQVLHKIKND